jgi:hypothetical protein
MFHADCAPRTPIRRNPQRTGVLIGGAREAAEITKRWLYESTLNLRIDFRPLV